MERHRGFSGNGETAWFNDVTEVIDSWLKEGALLQLQRNSGVLEKREYGVRVGDVFRDDF